MARVKQREGEDFSDSTLERVIAGLSAEKPITKKAACEMLNISYNTKRLDSIIENFIQRKEYAKERRKKMRTQAITDVERVEVARDYLGGASLSEISDSTYRSIAVVKRILNQMNIPLRSAENNYFNPVYLEDTADDYEEGDLVFSARYNTPAYIVKQVVFSDIPVYKIYLTGDYEKFAFQPCYDLGDLRKLQKMGVDIKTMPGDEVKQLLYEAWLKSKKMDTKGK